MRQMILTLWVALAVGGYLNGNAAAQTIDDLQRAFAKAPDEIAYDAQDSTRALLQDSPEDGRYLAVNAKISGLDLSKASCRDESWTRVLLNMVFRDSKTVSLEVSFDIGGYNTPKIPLLLISDSRDGCKATVVRFERVTPFVRIGADTDVKVQYHFGFGKQIDPVVFKLVSETAQAVVEVAGVSNGLLSALTSPALAKAADKFEKLFREAAAVNYLDTQKYQFGAKDKKGLRFGSTAQGSASVELTVIGKLSIATNFQNGWTPSYAKAGNIIDERLNPPGFANEGVYPTIRLHMNRNDAGSARYKAFQAAKAENFPEACGDLHQELYTTLGLSRSDAAAALFRLSQSARKMSLLNDNLCGGDPDITQCMADCDLDVGQGEITPGRIRAMQNKAEELAKKFDTALLNGQTALLDTALLAADSHLDVHGDFFADGMGRITDRQKVLRLLTSLKPDILGCHVAVPGQIPPSIWNVLFVAQKKPGIAQLSFDDLTAPNPKIASITLLPALSSDPQVAELLSKARTNPKGGCGKVLPAFGIR